MQTSEVERKTDKLLDYMLNLELAYQTLNQFYNNRQYGFARAKLNEIQGTIRLQQILVNEIVDIVDRKINQQMRDEEICLNCSS